MGRRNEPLLVDREKDFKIIFILNEVHLKHV